MSIQNARHSARCTVRMTTVSEYRRPIIHYYCREDIGGRENYPVSAPSAPTFIEKHRSERAPCVVCPCATLIKNEIARRDLKRKSCAY